MKAMTYAPPEVKSGIPVPKIVDLPIPSVQNGQVLVRIHFAALNYYEIGASKGQRNGQIARALKRNPVVSGIEMAGIVESDGMRFKKGDRVFGYTHITRGPFFHAQYAAVPEKYLAKVPENFSLEGAASVVGGALTSIPALVNFGHLEKRMKVLITGGSGSVGVTAVQLAAHLGADISATCHSSQSKFVLAQGANRTFAYDRQEWPEARNQFDLMFDAVPSLSFNKAGKYLKARGSYVTSMPHHDIGGFVSSLFSRRRWGFLLVYDTDAMRMDELSDLMEAGALQALVDSVFKLEQAKEALDHQLNGRKRGKILLDMGQA
jgi:NADPH:quinone reductase-like Zn-dependent oxidoreductase